MGELNLDRIEKALMKERERDICQGGYYPEESTKAIECFQSRSGIPAHNLRNQLLTDNDLAVNLNHSHLSIV